MVALVAELAGPGGRVLELGVGTGRLAVPLAERDLRVTGVDASSAMLERLRARDRQRLVDAVEGDMVDDLPPGPFDCVFVAYNTLFNLESSARQAACFAAVAARLAADGRFVVDAFVPEDPPRSGTVVALRSMTADEVVLSVSDHDPAAQRAVGHLVQLVDGQPVRLRPWAVRYAPPAELDAIRRRCGPGARRAMGGRDPTDRSIRRARDTSASTGLQRDDPENASTVAQLRPVVLLS